MGQPLNLTWEDGDDYFDVPVSTQRSAKSVNVATIAPNPLASAVAALFGGSAPKPIIVRFETYKLRWCKPVFDGSGKIIGKIPRATA